MVETLEVDLVHATAPLEANEHLTAGEAGCQLVGSVGGDQRQIGEPHRRQLLEDANAVGVGPVEVFENEQGSSVADPLGDGIDGDGTRVDEVDRRVAEHRADEGEGPAERAGVSLGDEHLGVRRHGADELLDQARLADTCLTGDEGDSRTVVVTLAAGSDDEHGQMVEGGGPPDHHRADAATTDEHAVESTDNRGRRPVGERIGASPGEGDKCHVRSRRHHARRGSWRRSGRVVRIRRLRRASSRRSAEWASANFSVSRGCIVFDSSWRAVFTMSA